MTGFAHGVNMCVPAHLPKKSVQLLRGNSLYGERSFCKQRFRQALNDGLDIELACLM